MTPPEVQAALLAIGIQPEWLDTLEVAEPSTGPGFTVWPVSLMIPVHVKIKPQYTVQGMVRIRGKVRYEYGEYKAAMDPVDVAERHREACAQAEKQGLPPPDVEERYPALWCTIDEARTLPEQAGKRPRMYAYLREAYVGHLYTVVASAVDLNRVYCPFNVIAGVRGPAMKQGDEVVTDEWGAACAARALKLLAACSYVPKQPPPILV